MVAANEAAGCVCKLSEPAHSGRRAINVPLRHAQVGAVQQIEAGQQEQAVRAESVAHRAQHSGRTAAHGAQGREARVHPDRVARGETEGPEIRRQAGLGVLRWHRTRRPNEQVCPRNRVAFFAAKCILV
jgi:hypothetical protein